MTQKHDMTTPKMTRVTVRVPRTTLDQINEWVDTLGVRRSHFLGIALVAGVRALIRASALDVAPDARAGEPTATGRGVALSQNPVGRLPSAADTGQPSQTPEVASLRAQIGALEALLAEKQ